MYLTFMRIKTCRSIAAIIAFFCMQPVFAQPADSVFTAGTPVSGNLLKVQNDGGFIIRGTYDGGIGSGTPAQEGPGTRLLWYPQKASFRAGYIDATQWDNANIGYFSFAAGSNTRASGDNSVALGINCWAGNSSTFAAGENNTATGAASVALGYHAHTNARQGSFVFADRSTVDTLRAGVNHSANWRLSGGFRIFTSSNLSTGVTLQSGASVSNWGQASAVISTSTGALLTTGGVWTNASDVNRKHFFENVSGETLLKKLAGVPIQEWSYKTEDNSVRHIGPMAQDFRKAFGLGNDELTIGTVDADGIALACIQTLETRTSKQAEELEALKTANNRLLARLEALEKKPEQKGKLLAAAPLAFIPMIGIGAWYFRRRQNKKING